MSKLLIFFRIVNRLGFCVGQFFVGISSS